MQWNEIIQEFAQSIGFRILRSVVGHFTENRFGIVFDNGQFEQQCGVEHYIGIFLIWENPFFFARPYTGPSADGLFGRISPILVVTDDASEQPVVGSRALIMVIQ